jgi:hypothetical protein
MQVSLLSEAMLNSCLYSLSEGAQTVSRLESRSKIAYVIEAYTRTIRPTSSIRST